MGKSETNIDPFAIENAADKLVRQAFLFDFYGELLNEHQRRIYEAYAGDNLSLTEIAEENSVSRQSVHDLIKRCDGILEQYESKLHLVEKFQNMKREITRIRDIAEYSDECNDMMEIRSIAENLLLEL